MKPIYLSLLMAATLCITSYQSLAQIPGFINRQATSAMGRTVLDPNNDGYTSATTDGYTINDVVSSEINYQRIKAYSIAPYGDLRRAPDHGYSEFVPDS